jgi:hypothetical protein
LGLGGESGEGAAGRPAAGPVSLCLARVSTADYWCWFRRLVGGRWLTLLSEACGGGAFASSSTPRCTNVPAQSLAAQ